MGLLVFALIGLLGFMGYRMYTRPRKLAEGGWLVLDRSDGPLRILFALYALWLSTGVLRMVLVASMANYVAKPVPARWAIGIGLAVYAWIVWHEGRKVVEAVFAAPGELRAEEWPLVSGDTIDLVYTRKLRMGQPEGRITAHLVQWTVIHDRYNGKYRTRRVRSRDITLKTVKSTFTDGRIEAVFRLDVPEVPEGAAAFKQAIFDFFFSQRQKSGWVLEVNTPFKALSKLDSSFKIDIAANVAYADAG